MEAGDTMLFSGEAVPSEKEASYDIAEICPRCHQPVPYGCAERGCQGSAPSEKEAPRLSEKALGLLYSLLEIHDQWIARIALPYPERAKIEREEIVARDALESHIAKLEAENESLRRSLDKERELWQATEHQRITEAVVLRRENESLRHDSDLLDELQRLLSKCGLYFRFWGKPDAMSGRVSLVTHVDYEKWPVFDTLREAAAASLSLRKAGAEKAKP